MNSDSTTGIMTATGKVEIVRGDYVLHADQFSAFNGTPVNATLAEGVLTMPINTASSWSTHFSANGWTDIADQIAAGKSLYGQPVPSSATYTEVIDFGATLAASNVSVTPTYAVAAGSPTLSIAISTSNTSATGPWTAYAAGDTIYATNFRWVQIVVTVASPDGLSMLQLSSLETKLSLKLKGDAGSVTANAGDSGGTNVNFNIAFVDVASITVTAQGSTPLTAIYAFAGTPYPTDFQVYLFNSSGTRVSGTVSWTANGY